MTVGNDIQLAVDFQAAAGVVEHLPCDVIGQRMLLVKRRVAEHSIKAERLHAGERVVDHKLAAINASGMLVSTFKRLEATAIGDSSTNTTFACGFYQAASDQ